MPIKKSLNTGAKKSKNLDSYEKINDNETIKSKKQIVDIPVIQDLEILKNDHESFRDIIADIKQEFKEIAVNIEAHTKNTSKHLESLVKDNRENVRIIAGKKQVPISIFAIVVVLLSALLVASEVRYSQMDLKITTSGIEIDHDGK